MPKNLSEVVFQNPSQKSKFNKYVNDGVFPHLLLSGPPGSGKSSISNALIAEFNLDPIDILRINASKENSVDVMREKISNFVESYACGPFKAVQLEEMDRLSPAAQDALRVITEDYSDHVRFIGTCNHANKITQALKSRLTHYVFKAPAFEDSAVLVANILVNEGVDFDIDLLEKYIRSCYPDLRALLMTLQDNSVDGKLTEPESATSHDYKFKLLELFGRGNLREARKVVSENVSNDEYEDLYSFMYENVDAIKSWTPEIQESAIVLIADYLYKNSMMANQELNFAALCIRLDAL